MQRWSPCGSCNIQAKMAAWSSKFSGARLSTPLICDYYKIDNYLLTSGSIETLSSENWLEPLHRAVSGGFSQLVRKVLSHSTDVDVQDLLSRTALHLAVSFGHKEIVEILLEHSAQIDIEDVHGYTPLCEAVWRQSTEMVKILLNAGAKPSDKYCLLHYSVLKKNLTIAKLLLDAGANPNYIDGDGDTPLLVSACNLDVDTAKLLLENGAKPDYASPLTGITTLHLLVSRTHEKGDYDTFENFVKLLVKHGADLDVSNLVGTAVTSALLMGKYRNAQYLIKIGANVNKLRSGEISTLSNLTIAFRNKQFPMIKLLVAAGHDLADESLNLQLPKNTKDADLECPTGWLLHKKFNPCSLAEICRIQIRKDLKSRVSIVVPNLQIPRTLQNFLMLEGISNEKNLSSAPYHEWY